MSVNKVIVIGNLGAKPDIRALPSGQNVANFSLATTERFTDRNGAKQERTLTATHMVRGEMRAAREMAQQLLRLAEQTRDPGQLLWGHSQIGMIAFHRGELLIGREHNKTAIALYDRERDTPRRYMGLDVGVVDLSYAGWILWHLGYPDQALKASHEARELAEALSHPDSLVFALGYQCNVRYARREIEALQELAKRQIVLCGEYGLATFLEGANLYVGWAMTVQGRDTEGIDRLQKAITTQRATGFGMLYPRGNTLVRSAMQS